MMMSENYILALGAVFLVAALVWGVYRKTPISVAAPFFLGTCVGWITHPVLWTIYYSPFRLYRYLCAMVELESAWSTDAIGDTSLTYSSYGLLQFQSYNWENLTGTSITETDNWKSPYRQAIVGAAYLQDAILTSPIWLVWLRAPILAPLAHRVLWRRGVVSVWGYDSDGPYLLQETAIFKPYLYWMLWTLPFSMWFTYRVIASAGPMMKRRKRR